ncbi:hypothetical protein ABT364_27455 [Massilia sp. SR12]
MSISLRRGTPIPPIDDEESWALYALSRALDLLIGTGPAIPVDQYVAFVEALGMKVLQPQQFSPFFHEVVALEPSASSLGAATIQEFIWPCVMLGEMLVSRAGVRVSAGAQVLTPGVADASTLYWTYLRTLRPHQDLSHGWGGNSQWRTRFRRDFAIDGKYYFNVDGKRDLATQSDEDESGLSLGERIELLTNRCFVRCEKPHDDLWPYDDCHVVAAHPADGTSGAPRVAGWIARLVRKRD